MLKTNSKGEKHLVYISQDALKIGLLYQGSEFNNGIMKDIVYSLQNLAENYYNALEEEGSIFFEKSFLSIDSLLDLNSQKFLTIENGIFYSGVNDSSEIIAMSMKIDKPSIEKLNHQFKELINDFSSYNPEFYGNSIDTNHVQWEFIDEVLTLKEMYKRDNYIINSCR